MGNVDFSVTTEKAHNFGRNIQTITTLEIAEMMETEHSKILRKLEGDETHKGIITVMSEAHLGVAEYFQESTYLDAQGKTRKCYNVTKLGCDFLANKFTGEKGILFTAKYVKRFDEMEKHIKENDKPSLEAVNKAADMLSRVYRAAGTDERYLALLVGSVYKECGMEFTLPPVKMDTNKLYDQTMIAEELGVMSTSGKPHPQAIGAIIDALDISDDDKISTPYTNHGHSGVVVQYKENVCKAVQQWIQINDYPKTIKGKSKSYNVIYK